MNIYKRKLGLIKSSNLLSTAHVKKAVKMVLSSEKVKTSGEVNIIFVDNKTIRKINKSFLDETGVTDVIAFPYDSDGGKDAPFGDVYISVPVAKDNAKRFNQSLHQELTRLVVHGLLHILGYDDHRPKDKKIMWTKQEKLVSRLCSKKKS